jgi:hypothetical protein
MTRRKITPEWTIEKVDLRTRTFAVYADIYIKNKKGVLYKFHASSFTFDLEKVDAKSVGTNSKTKSRPTIINDNQF